MQLFNLCLLLWCSNAFVKLSCKSFPLIWPYSGSVIQKNISVVYHNCSLKQTTLICHTRAVVLHFFQCFSLSIIGICYAGLFVLSEHEQSYIQITHVEYFYYKNDQMHMLIKTNYLSTSCVIQMHVAIIVIESNV